MKLQRVSIAGVVIFICLGQLWAQQSFPRQSVKEVSTQVMAVIGTVVEHHIAPPTRQQLVLEAIQRAALRRRYDLPNKFAKEISSTPPDELDALLHKHLAAVARVQSGLRVSEVLPSELHLTSRKADRVEKQLQANRYVGIGIRLGADRSGVVMHNVIEGGPAARAGARNGDHIKQINGKSTQGKNIGQIIEELRGLDGTEVEVTLLQPGEEESRTYTMTRGVVPIPGVGTIVQSSNGRAAGIRIERVSASTVQELRKKETELPDTTELVIIDARFLSDHNLHNGELLINALIDNQSVGNIETHEGVRQFKTEPGRLFSRFQLAFLIGPATGGTIEWIAAALQDHQQAEVLGLPTQGRGFVSKTIPTETEDLMVELPVGQLRRSTGHLLFAKTPLQGDPRQALRMHVPQRRFVDNSTMTRQRIQTQRYAGPGVRPDFHDIDWAETADPGDRENHISNLPVAVERVAELLLKEVNTESPSVGEE